MLSNKRICLLTLVTLFSLAQAVRADIKVGDKFPDFGDCKIDGNLPDRAKDKVILVDFWASWCGPCLQSFPVMEELQRTYGPRGFMIIAVNVDEQKTEMERFLKEHPVSFCVVRDAKQILVGKANIDTMPSSFMLNKDGKVVFMHNGFHGSETKKQYEHEIESLLGPDQK